MTMADRIMLMNAGNIEQIGAPLQLYDNPTSEFVAGFVGSPPINLIKGDIDGKTFFCSGITIPLPEQNWTPGATTVGIRPEEVSVVMDKTTSHAEGVVTHMECTGDRTLLEVQVANNTIRVSSSDRFDLNTRALVKLVINPAQCHFFQNGLRLDTTHVS